MSKKTEAMLSDTPEAEARKYDASYRSLDPDDIDDFSFDPSYAESVETLVFTKIDVRKPHDQSPVRVCPDPAYSRDLWLLLWGRNKVPHLVLPKVVPYLGKHAIRHNVHLAVEFPNVPFLWATRFIGDDPDPNSYVLSQYRAKLEAMKQWIRMESNRDKQCYDVLVSKIQPPTPAWPTEPLAKLLALGFEGKVIADKDHPIPQRLLTTGIE